MELTLFVIVGAVAILSAAMMLISENAIYSALFLILNFGCIAFFFLLLNAAFLAMVQIAVYAGAIMVLFLFVIMLLGAENLAPGEPSRLRWMAPAAVVLSVVFLVTASLAIVSGEIELTEQQSRESQVRVVHAIDGIEAIDVYLDDDLIADNVAYLDHTRFEPQTVGRFMVTVYVAGESPAEVTPLAEQVVDLTEQEVVSLVGIGRLDDASIVAATEDVTHLEESKTLRILAINALPRRVPVDVRNEDNGNILIENLAYGQASENIDIGEGDYDLGLYPVGDARSRIMAVEDAELDADTAMLWVFTQDLDEEANALSDVVIDLKTETLPTFGGPTHIGQILFSRYVLPFEMVALLLLVAMIGAIVLTHGQQSTRRRIVRRLANPPAALKKPITGEPGQ